MSIDNATWHARVCMLYALKPLLKSKSSTINFSEFSPLTFIFRIILLHLINVNLFSKCILTKNITTYLPLLPKLPKMSKIAIFLFPCLTNSLFRCGDIDTNPVLKYS